MKTHLNCLPLVPKEPPWLLRLKVVGVQFRPDLARDSDRKLILLPRFEHPAFERLTRREFVPHELLSLIEEFLMSENVDCTVRSLAEDGAQAFIDVMDEVRVTYAPTNDCRSIR